MYSGKENHLVIVIIKFMDRFNNTMRRLMF